MKPKRSILVFDEERNLPVLRLVLRTQGFIAFTRSTERECRRLLASAPFDGVVIGAEIKSEISGPHVVRRRPDESTAQLLERIRASVVRKPGPKPRTAMRDQCFNYIDSQGSYGATLREICGKFNKLPCQLSSRITELLAGGKIRRSRSTRMEHAVYVTSAECGN